LSFCLSSVLQFRLHSSLCVLHCALNLGSRCQFMNKEVPISIGSPLKAADHFVSHSIEMSLKPKGSINEDSMILQVAMLTARVKKYRRLAGQYKRKAYHIISYHCNRWYRCHENYEVIHPGLPRIVIVSTSLCTVLQVTTP